MRRMAQVHIVHVYNCGEAAFWKLFFDEEYNLRLFLQALRFPAYEQLSLEENEHEIRRVTRLTPPVGDLPGPLRRVIGEGIGYREVGVFDRQARRFTIDVVPNKMPDRLTVRGVLHTEAVDERTSRRRFDGTVAARLVGIGGMLEQRLVADMKANYAASAEFTNRYIAELGW
jgi:hypothetical protein